MPVIIVKKKPAAPPPPKEPDVPEAESAADAPKPKKERLPNLTELVEGRPKLGKVLKIGAGEILPDMDLGIVPGKTKFLINFRREKAYNYLLCGFDGEQMKLKSEDGNYFNPKMVGSVAANYMVAVLPGEVDVKKIPADIVAAVKKLYRVPDPILEEAGEVASAEKPPAAKKKGVLITRKK